MEASVATPGQGAPPAGTAPAGSQGDAGQGQPTAAGKGDGAFNWGLFPDVPVEQRELLEPHLRNVQGHVTRVEQQYAPYKGLVDSLPPEQVENLVGFLEGYNTDPVATILGIVQQMQQEGALSPQQLASLNGGAPPAEQQAQPTQEEMPEWARQMQSRLDQYDQAEQQRQAAQQDAEMQQTLETAKTNIRGQLTQGGIGEDLVPDETIVAFIIAHDGDEQAAANAIGQMRQNFLADFTNNPGGRQEPTVQGQLPKAPKPSGRRDPDGFKEANIGARQFLEQSARAGASG